MQKVMTIYFKSQPSQREEWLCSADVNHRASTMWNNTGHKKWTNVVLVMLLSILGFGVLFFENKGRQLEEQSLT